MNTTRVPANCFVEKLLCGALYCEAEMQRQFSTTKPSGEEVYIYTCPECSSFQEHAVQYPRLVWEEAV
jgi:hypothetical protein